jgi:serine/threonine-protein kinase RsbW
MTRRGSTDTGESEPGDHPGAPTTEGPSCVCWPEAEHASTGWLREKLVAEPRAVGRLRRRMRSWAQSLELDEELAESIVLIVDEAVSNAVEHACPGWECHVEVVAGPRACGGGVAVLVADDGVWQEMTDPGFRGRGVTLIGRLSDRSSIEVGEQGTTVRMCWPVERASADPDTA